jgi:hypothetical protein
MDYEPQNYTMNNSNSMDEMDVSAPPSIPIASSFDE